jgi:PAS domain S-box-containing protein
MGYATLEGRPYLIGVARDISERLEQENALRQSELRYRTLVERMNEGLILTDKEELILFVNDRVCQIMGQPRENLMGRYSYEALQGEKVEEIIREKTQLRLDGISDQYELKLNHPRGKPIYVLVAGAPYIDALGDTVGTIAIITDITDRKLTEIKLQEKNDELDAFVYKASHDLRGPLASIIGLTNIVQDEVSDQTALRYFSLIARSTKRLDNILSELLDVTRINKAPLKLEWVNLQELVVDIYASLQHQQGGTEVARLYDITTTDWVSDKKLLTSILQNLIVNSVNYHNPQTQTPYVIVKVRKAQQAIQIEVNDNGMGIPPKMKNKVFEMFFRGSNQSKGSGLGLYIVKNAVEKLQGAITVESEERIGSTFTITLPDLSDEMPAA